MKRAATAVLIGALALLGGCSRATPVEVVKVSRATLRDTFREQCETRLQRSYPVVMPVAGRIGRIALEPGDSVRSGQVLVNLDQLPPESELAEARQEVQERSSELRQARNLGTQEAGVERAQAQLSEARRGLGPLQATEKELEARWRQAGVDRERSLKLYAEGAMPRQQLEQAQLSVDSAHAQLLQLRARIESQRAAVGSALAQVHVTQEELQQQGLSQQVAIFRLQQAEARRDRAQHRSQLSHIFSPINGLVVERYQQGPGPLGAGEKLLLLGRLSDLEAMAEVLTQDALRLKVGTPAKLTANLEQPAVLGKVKRIEPGGYTKLSSLGVEQKRVKVILSFDKIPQKLGIGYRLEAEFLVKEKPAALFLPRYSVMQEPSGQFFCWTVQAGKLAKTPIQLGLLEDLRVEIVQGLQEGQRVVANPDSALQVGDPVTEAN